MDHGTPKLAERLLNLGVKTWAEDEVRERTADLGWEWDDSGRTPVLRTGHPAGDAYATPVDEFTEDFTSTEEVLGVHQPLAEVGGGTREHVAAFQREYRSLCDSLGFPGLMGAYGRASFFWDSPRWGGPFARWRDKDRSLELRATGSGPVLTLLPSEPLEGWYVFNHENGAGTMSGFLAVASSRTAFGDLGGLHLPGVHGHSSWKDYGRLLSSSLGTMAAEMTALGLERSFGFHGRIPGTTGPWVFGFDIGETMRMSLYGVADREDLAPEERGWIRTNAPEDLEYGIAFHTEPVPYDEVNGTRLALMVTEMAEDLGIPSPADLSLTDWADTIRGNEAHNRPGYHLYHHGLAVTENP
ncbi:hypothetical protein [Nocardiopsis sp. CC223A]|uniref:hypothetical protein n=1 Tax=Nocardiopsis sp. CC223A TaxID=3044051 RepID=UPI00278C476F|nr:hypothetical protein [Nocardiopsis sp. CC223A]